MIRNTQRRKHHDQLPDFIPTLCCCQSRHKSTLAESHQNQITVICIWQVLYIFLNCKQICNLCKDSHIRGFAFTLQIISCIESASATKAETKRHITHLRKIPAKVIHICVNPGKTMTDDNCRIAFLLPEIRR